MIFVTVGTDLPFDRLVRVVDQWAQRRGRNDVFAQIGETEWRPAHIEFSKFLEPPEFKKRFASAKVIVAHAGMGTILSALHYEKPILVMPRQAVLGEQRNDHQLATARQLLAMGKVTVAFDEAALIEKLEMLEQLRPTEKIDAFAGTDLLTGIRNFIHQPRS